MIAVLSQVADSPVAGSPEAGRAHTHERYLGPAEVIATGKHRIDISLPSGDVAEATLALAFPYNPVVGDTLLVIGQPAADSGNEGGELFVIGVIAGQGKTDLCFQGDVNLRAEKGKLTLSGEEGVAIRGPLLDIFTDKFSLVATRAMQKFETYHQRVRELMTVEAKQSHLIVEKASVHRAQKVTIIAEETASVNGKQILLG